MACYYPNELYYGYDVVNGRTETRIRKLSDKDRKHDEVVKAVVPCRQCMGCRIDKSKEWSVRCMHELQMHNGIGSFLTLTYAPDQLPKNSSVVMSDLQKFLKRLRKHFKGTTVRHFSCGEYGDNGGEPELGHPHYHCIIFGVDFDADKYAWKTVMHNRQKYTYWRSSTLEKLWPYGYSIIGDVTQQSTAYVARYITKKINGDLKDKHYTRIDKETGEVLEVMPEFVAMSTRPGIGASWLEKYYSDVFPSDECIIEGKKYKVPKYYLDWYEKHFPDEWEELKQKRVKYVREKPDETWGRLSQKYACHIAKVTKKVRTL